MASFEKPTGRSPLEAHSEKLLELFDSEPDLTLDQIVLRISAERGLQTSRSAVARFYHRHGARFHRKSMSGWARLGDDRYARESVAL